MFFRAFRNLRVLFPSARLAARLLRDPSVPVAPKLVPLLGLLYFISPIDLVPDAVLPLLGELDDIAILIVTLKVFPFVCPAPAVQHHQRAIAERKPYTPLPPEADFIDV